MYRSGLQRLRFRRRSSKASDSGSDEEPTPVIPHQDVFLDDHLPVEYFKQDILKLVHSLRIPRWSNVQEDMAEDVQLERISGALTNSVYSVTPPAYLKNRLKNEFEGRYHHRMPQNLLLRVYGPQVDMLIDRQKELDTVSQLTKHKIGAKLLGTFTNGRFEQFLHAKALSRHDLSAPETSVLIAKRMRDLHDNVSVSDCDRSQGPLVWCSIDKWKTPVIEKLRVFEDQGPGSTVSILGTEKEEFFKALDTYRDWLLKQYGGQAALNKSLVFAHNDTQYGNILRMEPPAGSPLLRPQNEHRQLAVIDFEFSGANVRAYDIANHFCEWMGDYHHPTDPHHIWTERYPSDEEQMRFISSYVEHGSNDFDERAIEEEASRLFTEVKLWLPSVSVFWAFWGIIQAPEDSVKDTRLREDMHRRKNNSYEFLASSPVGPTESHEIEDDPFDYVAYSREKVRLFWDYVQQLGIPELTCANF